MNKDLVIEQLEYFVSRVWDGEAESYYNSSEWKAMRELVLRIQGYSCNRCDLVSKHPHVHHCFGLYCSFDPENHFEVLCFDCHNRHHYYKLSDDI